MAIERTSPAATTLGPVGTSTIDPWAADRSCRRPGTSIIVAISARPSSAHRPTTEVEREGR